MTDHTRRELDRTRRALDEANGATRRLQMRTAAARRRLVDAERTASSKDRIVRDARAGFEAEERRWRSSRAEVLDARRNHLDALTAWLGDDGAKDFERLSAEYPILLLPVRIETRFFIGDAAELRVRIYPDEIAADTHEPELTAAEEALGQQFWQAGWQPANELAAWQALLGQAAPTRAAWIVRATTPTNVQDRSAGAPVFAAVPLKDGSWSRPAHAQLLPDRWIVLCYRGGQEVHRTASRPVVTPLALTLSPDAQGNPNDLVDISGDGLTVERELLWTLDFAEAERVGMAVRLRIGADDVTAGFDRVYVLGVRGSLAPDAAAGALETMIDSHHFGRGFAFVPPGTPTNNMTGQPSGYPPPDSDGLGSFQTERGAPKAIDGTDGARLARALGVNPSVLDHVNGADRFRHRHAAAMNRVLWPVTWGYFFKQLMRDALAEDTQRALYELFVGAVHGGGALPLFRIGSTPYGVVTVSALSRWQARDSEPPLMAALPGILRLLLPTWTRAIPQVPRAGRTGDPDRDLIELLEMDASAREVWIRNAFGGDFVRNLGTFLGADLSGSVGRRAELRGQLEDLFGLEASRGPVVDFFLDDRGHKFRGGLVSDVPVSEDATLDFNYLAWLKPPTSIEDIRHERFPADTRRPGSLLYRLVRQAILLMYRDAALDLTIKAKLAVAEDRLERELIGIVDGTEERMTTWDHFAKPIPNVTGTASLGDYLPQAAAQQRAVDAGRALRNFVRPTPDVLPLRDYAAALESLQSISTAELEQLLGETLDCCSHRLDAWIAALATRRLEQMRAATPRGVHLGAFAWVEGLRSNRATRLRSLDRDPRVQQQLGSGGFIHAPTLDHAAAAAVLRNAYVTRSGAAQTPYALDLSSERVRLARWLLASVREGQPLTAILGYRFERALHERQLDRFIEPLRLKFPLPAAAGTVGPSPQESIAPRDVVHGLGLRKAWKDQTLDLATLTAAPPPTSNERTALAEELTRLDDTFDAVADLVTADSVYQLVRGTQSRAGASLDAMASDARPPEGDFAQAPRSGTMLTHRVILVLGGEPPAPAGWNAPSSPRADAEPRLDGWLGARLGPAADIRARVLVPVPTVNAPDAVQEVPVSLATLGLRPLDFLALIPSSGARLAGAVVPHADGRASRGAELERRLADAALNGAPQQGTIRLDLSRDAGWPANVRSLGEALEIARALKALVGGTRALRPADLVAPEHVTQTSTADLMPAEANQRAADALTGLNDRILALEAAIAAIPSVAPGDPEPNLEPLRQQLRAASLFGVPDAYPAIRHTIYTDLKTLVDARIAEVGAAPPPADLEPLRAALRRARQTGVTFEPPQIADGGNPADVVATLRVAATVSEALAIRSVEETRNARIGLLTLAGTVRDALAARRTAANAATTADARMKAVFGSDFVWAPRFRPVRAAELDAALAQGPSLGATAVDTRRWLAQAAQVRAPLRRWRRVALYTQVIGTAPGDLELAQVPHVDPARWVGLRFASEADRPPSGRVSLALVRAAQPAAADPWCGLIVDEWPEVIPAREETGGLAFHYDDPGAEAAQALLLAVPPAAEARWDLESMVAILDEALMLSKIRAVHSEQLDGVGQILPAIYLATNARGDTVSTDFSKDRAVPARIILEGA